PTSSRSEADSLSIFHSVSFGENDGSWHEAAVRKCPLLRRLWGLSGHRRFMSTRPSQTGFSDNPVFACPRAHRNESVPALHGPGVEVNASVALRFAARILRWRFWKSVIIVLATVAVVVLFQYVRKGGLSLAGDTCLRIAAIMLALIAALG